MPQPLRWKTHREVVLEVETHHEVVQVETHHEVVLQAENSSRGGAAGGDSSQSGVPDATEAADSATEEQMMEFGVAQKRVSRLVQMSLTSPDPPKAA